MSVESEIIIGRRVPMNGTFKNLFMPECTMYLGKFTYGKLGQEFNGLFDLQTDFDVYCQNPDAELITSDAYGRPLSWTTVERIAEWYRTRGCRMKDNLYGSVMYQTLKAYIDQDCGDYAVVHYIF